MKSWFHNTYLLKHPFYTNGRFVLKTDIYTMISSQFSHLLMITIEPDLHEGEQIRLFETPSYLDNSS